MHFKCIPVILKNTICFTKIVFRTSMGIVSSESALFVKQTVIGSQIAFTHAHIKQTVAKKN